MAEPPPVDTYINIAVVGNADAAKSTLISVLANGVLDDGNGSARVKILVHRHERETGQSSSVNIIKVESQLDTSLRFGLIDLAGQEKYIRTTFRGLTGFFPKVALLVIAANRGITTITRNHFHVCKNLRIPIIIVVTKIDICPPERLTETCGEIKNMCKGHTGESKGFIQELFKPNQDIVPKLELFLNSPLNIYPMFLVSNTNGSNIDLLRDFLFQIVKQSERLQLPDNKFQEFISSHSIMMTFIIFRPYFIKGKGLIVHGFNRGAPISKGDHLYLGPYNTGYIKVRVRSIHDESETDIQILPNGVTGCLAIKPMDTKIEINRRLFSAGKVLLDKPFMVRQIRARVRVCGHNVTVMPCYSPYMHVEHVGSQCLVLSSKKADNSQGSLSEMTLTYPDEGEIIFQFIRPQFIHPGARLIVRDGNIKLIGVILEVFPDEVYILDRKSRRLRKEEYNLAAAAAANN